MLRKIPVVGCPIGLDDLLSGCNSFFANSRTGLDRVTSEFLKSKHIFFTNSATSSFYTVLRTLKERKKKYEVILPAYTASSLIHAIRQAELKPVLCDISLSNFNMNLDMLADLISRNTLAILGVHMFGIVADGLDDLRKRFPDIFIIEDCAQALGSRLNGKPVGNSGNVSFFSFNRGKNLPVYAGGCIATNNEMLAGEIGKRVKNLKAESLFFKFSIPFKILALSLIIKPCLYGLLCPLISPLREKAPPEDFTAGKYTAFQAGVLFSLFKKIDEFSKKRYQNGMKLTKTLKNARDLMLPEIPENTQPAFNRLPIVFKDPKKRKKAEVDLWKEGIASSCMYHKPLHHIFDLGYKKNDFPNAVYFAEHLLTLPVHPLLDDADLDKIAEIIRGTSG